MSPGDVHDNEMNEPTDIDDALADALLAGSGQESDPALAAAVLAIRGLATSTPPSPRAELMQLMGTAPKGPHARRRTWTWPAKIGTAAAVVIAATGGLATAHALPAPMQDAISHLGIGRPAHSHPSGSNAPTPNTGADRAALGRSYVARGSAAAAVGAPNTTAPGSPPATALGANRSTGDANSCADRAKHVAMPSVSSPTKSCSTAAPAPTPSTTLDPTTTTSTPTPTPGDTTASSDGTSHAGGNGTSNAGGNSTSSAGGNGTSHAGGNGTSHAGGNGTSNAGGNARAKPAP